MYIYISSDAVKKIVPEATDTEINTALGNYLKNAPDRKGGGGRTSKGQN